MVRRASGHSLTGARVLPAPLEALSPTEATELLNDLNYLNMDEVKTVCTRHAIPFAIWIDTGQGRPRKSRDTDRKAIVLERIRHFLQTGRNAPATCYAPAIVKLNTWPERPAKTDRLFYGQYTRQNTALFACLATLTHNRFKDGAHARILAHEYWRRGIAPTLEEFAQTWLQTRLQPAKAHPEWAFLADCAAGRSTADWKNIRKAKAQHIMAVLARICPSAPPGPDPHPLRADASKP